MTSNNGYEVIIKGDTLELVYPLGYGEDAEHGSEHFGLVPTQPSNLLRLGRVIEDERGRRYQLGSVLKNGCGSGVAWRV